MSVTLMLPPSALGAVNDDPKCAAVWAMLAEHLHLHNIQKAACSCAKKYIQVGCLKGTTEDANFRAMDRGGMRSSRCCT